jgi:hypothetical protein
MPPIQSPQDLLVHLAGNGDPSAFYTLAAPCVYSTYIFLRNQGKSHSQAMAILVPFLKKIHKNFLTSSRDIPFKTWYESQRKKLVPDAVDSQVEKTLLETIPSDDISHFESQMKLVFQQNYGKLRRVKNGFDIRRWIFSRFLPKFAAVVLGFLIIVIGLQIFLTLAGITLSLSVSATGYNRLVSLPSAINKHFFSITTPALQQPAAATIPAESKTDTTKTLKNLSPSGGESALPKEKIFESPGQGAGIAQVAASNPDSIGRPIPVKKPVSPHHRARAASSTDLGIAPVPAAPAKPSSDSDSQPSYQKKQPASLPESSIIAP